MEDYSAVYGEEVLDRESNRDVLAAVLARPRATIPELAADMDRKQNFLYRILPTLEGAGMVERRGQRWYPLEGSGDALAEAKARQRRRRALAHPHPQKLGF